MRPRRQGQQQRWRQGEREKRANEKGTCKEVRMGQQEGRSSNYMRCKGREQRGQRQRALGGERKGRLVERVEGGWGLRVLCKQGGSGPI